MAKYYLVYLELFHLLIQAPVEQVDEIKELSAKVASAKVPYNLKIPQSPPENPPTPPGPLLKTTIIVTITAIIIIRVDLIGVAISSKTVKANNVPKEDCDALEVLAQVLVAILMMVVVMVIMVVVNKYLFCDVLEPLLTSFPFFDFILFTTAGGTKS